MMDSQEILSDRTQRLKRNLLALSIVIIASNLLADQVDLSDMNFFGAELKGDDQQNESLLHTILWYLLAYHTALFVLFGFKETMLWYSGTFKASMAPSIRMLLFFRFYAKWHELEPGAEKSPLQLAWDKNKEGDVTFQEKPP